MIGIALTVWYREYPCQFNVSLDKIDPCIWIDTYGHFFLAKELFGPEFTVYLL